MVDTFRYSGFGQEATFGTAVDAVFHIDSENGGLDSPDNPEVEIPTGMGRSVRAKRPGYYASQGNIDFPPDIETIGWFFRWGLTGYQFTSGTPNLHEIYATASTSLKSFTVRQGRDNWEQVFPGCNLNSLDLAIDTTGNLGKLTLGIYGGLDTPTTIKDYSSLLLSSSVPLGSAECLFYLDEVDDSVLMKNLRFSIANGIDIRSAQRFGSIGPRGGFIPKGLKISFTASLIFEDRTQKNLFWGSSTGPATLGSEEPPVSFRLTDFDQVRYLNICMPRVHITAVKTPTRGTDTLIQEVTGTAMLATDILLNDASLVDTQLLCTLYNYTGTMA